MGGSDYWSSNQALSHITPPGCTQPEGFDIHAYLRKAAGGTRVLEFGCGPGRLVKAFDPNNYLGVDINEAALLKAVEAHPGYSFVKYVGGRLPVHFDIAIAWTVLLHVDDESIAGICRELISAAPVVLVGEIMGRSWRRPGNPPVFNREFEEYVRLFESVGAVLLQDDLLPCVRYPGSEYTVLRFERAS